MKGTKQKERRSGDRAKMSIPVQICLEGKDEAVDYTTSNVSAGGIFVATEDPYPAGTRLSLELKLPALEQPVQAKGTVVRCLPAYDANEGAAGMGIQFSEDSRIDWDLLEKFIEG